MTPSLLQSSGSATLPLHLGFYLRQDQLTAVKLTEAPHLTYHIEGASPRSYALVEQWLEHYLFGAHETFPLPLDAAALSLFSRRVLLEMSVLPFGTTVSYQTIAQRSGHPRAARAVGTVCNRNPFPLVIPCHRIIQSNGSLGGFALGHKIKEKMLAFEREIVNTHSFTSFYTDETLGNDGKGKIPDS